MIINRKRPNDHTTAGVTFHPGSQFIADDYYRGHLKGNKDFQAQLDAEFMEIIVPAEEHTAAGKEVEALLSKAEKALSDNAKLIADAKTPEAIKKAAQEKTAALQAEVDKAKESAAAAKGKQKTSLAETIVALPEAKAIAVIKTIIDGVELKEISKLDKRRDVVAAAEAQITLRQGTMDGMAPVIPKATGNIPIGDFE
jgi:uncharacterized protein (UPF0147 family)